MPDLPQVARLILSHTKLQRTLGVFCLEPKSVFRQASEGTIHGVVQEEDKIVLPKYPHNYYTQKEEMYKAVLDQR